jgi:Fe-S cluster assembly protein SufD
MTLLDLPSNRAEGWRWSDLSALPALAGGARTQQTYGDFRDFPWLECAAEGPRLLFVDGELDASRSRLGAVETGKLDVGSLGSPARPPRRRQRMAASAGPRSCAAGLVQIIHVSSGAADHVPAEIDLGVDAQASVVETYLGEGWINRLTRIRLAQGARLMLSRRLVGRAAI